MQFTQGFTLLIVFLVLQRTCHSTPVFGYLFGDDEDAESPTNTDNNEQNHIDKPEIKISDSNLTPEIKEDHESRNNSPVSNTVIKDEVVTNKIVNAQPTSPGSKIKNERLGNVGTQASGDAVGFLAGTLSRGLRGLKGVVDHSTVRTKEVMQQMGNAQNSAFDNMQEAIDTNFGKTLNQVASWTEKMDMARRALSGTTKKNADKSHSITITTSSDAPIQTLTGLMNKYLPADSSTGSTPVPEITSIDFSNFWGGK